MWSPWSLASRLSAPHCSVRYGYLDNMNGKIDTVYCILVVATAVLVGIVKCTSCSSIKAP